MRLDLAGSGIANYPLGDLPFQAGDLTLEERNGYGYWALRERIAVRYGVRPESAVTANGASMAIHLALAGLIEAGDEVLIEHPAYEPMVRVAEYLGARVLRFSRVAGDGFRIDIEGLERALTSRTRVIGLTNLHNPSGSLTQESTLRRIGESARRVGAKVLVNEAYLDLVDFAAPRSAARLGNEFVVINSLTKAYGLSALRCGWILCEPRLAERMWRVNDLFGQLQPHPIERLSVVAFDHLPRIAARANAILRANHAAWGRFLASRSDLETRGDVVGTTVFPRLRHGDVDEFCELLVREYETCVVPGRFFEMADYFRIGLGGDAGMTAEGLDCLARALDRYAALVAE